MFKTLVVTFANLYVTIDQWDQNVSSTWRPYW